MTTDAAASDAPKLLRRVGLVQLTLYGLGSMLGAGIYGLVGKAAGVMGSAVWLAFLVSMVAAVLTGASYASIASRYPKAAGAAYATQRAYGRPLLSYVVGLAIVCSGLTSIATGSHVVAENLQVLLGLETTPLQLLIVGFLLIIGGLVFRGIAESLWANALCTLVEAAGLIFVIAVGLRYWGQASLLDLPTGADTSTLALTSLVLQGGVLTFFSFIGFEDMINVSEDVKRPERTVPLALLLAVAAATVIYMAVAVTAVSVAPWRELAGAAGPLTEVVSRAAPWFPAWGFTLITISAVANTGLINLIMGSRLLYGMAHQGLLPAPLARIHPRRHTPHVAIAVLMVVIIGLALAGDISALAASTVLLLLFVFTIVNVATFVLLRREGRLAGRFNVPLIIPALGAAVCGALVIVRVTQGGWVAPAIAGALILVILGLYALTGKDRAARIAGYVESEDSRPNPDV
jgi:basic amino acid/polyamine antiporter, APA family